MPISSGANSWPASYWHKPSPKQQNTKLVVIDREDSRPPSPIRKPSTPPPGPPAPPRPPPPDSEMMYIEHHSPPPQQKVFMPPHQSQHQMTYINHQRPPPPQQIIYQQPPNSRHSMRSVNHGYPGYHDYRNGGYPGGYGYGGGRGGGGGGGCGDASCCADNYFSTNTAGANAGCCQGGMFGSRRYPYTEEYMMKGTGSRRCCACVWGTIIGLLLLGLLIGLLAGLLPALKKQAAVSSILSQFQGGYYVDGVYYYKVTNPPDIFYFAMGPGIPCNPYNNNSALTPPPNVINYVPVTVNGTNSTVNVTNVMTQTPQVTLPDCKSITTSYILANGISVSTTTINPFLVLTSSAHTIYAKAFTTLLAVVVARVLLAVGGGDGVRGGG